MIDDVETATANGLGEPPVIPPPVQTGAPDPTPEPEPAKPPRRRISFGMVAPPVAKRLRIQAEDEHEGAPTTWVDTWAKDISVDIEASQESYQMAYDLIRKYISPEKRQLVPVEKGEEPTQLEPFPTGPMTGPITLTERSIFDTVNFFCMQDPEDVSDTIPWVEFVYMRKTSPNCYQAFQAAWIEFHKAPDEKQQGNTGAGTG